MCACGDLPIWLPLLLTAPNAVPVQRGQEAVQKIRDITGTSNTILAQLDIADPKSVDAFGAWAEKELGNVSILVNNAGAFRV